MSDIERKVIAAWLKAAADLGIQFTSAFEVATEDGQVHKYPGLVHRFGGRIGTLIRVLHQPSEMLPDPPSDDYYWSILGSVYGQYDRALFIETLKDWRFFGPDSERPEWYKE
jgi:hypothetical protein